MYMGDMCDVSAMLGKPRGRVLGVDWVVINHYSKLVNDMNLKTRGIKRYVRVMYSVKKTK